MSKLIPFKYRDFYDVPRLIVVRWKRNLFLLDSRFEDTTDEYSEYYSVYSLPPDTIIPEAGSWEHLVSKADRTEVV